MRKKFFVVIAIIVVLVILLTPVRMNLKDGGSVRYKALVYEVTKIHQLSPEAAKEPQNVSLHDPYAFSA